MKIVEKGSKKETEREREKKAESKLFDCSDPARGEVGRSTPRL